jgi:hypothetical protein
MNINTVSDFRRAVRHGPWAWPGGYPCYFITADGAALSFEALKRRGTLRNILEAIRDKDDRSGWRVVALDVNWEDDNLFCDDTGGRIDCAYPKEHDPDCPIITGKEGECECA